MANLTDSTNLARLEQLATVLELKTAFRKRRDVCSETKNRSTACDMMGSDQPEPEGEMPGKRLDLEDIKLIKQSLFGDRLFRFNDDWTNTSFMFQSIQSKCPYGLMAPQDGSRGIIAGMEAHILKHFMFQEADLFDSDSSSKKLPRPQTERQRTAALVSAMSTILWRAGRGRRAVVAVLHKIHPGLLYTEERRLEHLSDCLRYFECTSLKQLTSVLQTELKVFTDQDGGGALCFLYSLLLSRTLESLQADLQGEYLLTEHDRCAIPLLNLMVAGTATPHVFNGKILYDDEGDFLDTPVVGIEGRTEIGLFVVDRERNRKADPAKRIGSMLKTPKFPIWVTSLNRHVSVLFSTNVNLNRDWRCEQKFDLYYMNCQLKQMNATRITVDSRTIRGAIGSTTRRRPADPKSFPIVEECITSRWPGSRVDWNDSTPYF